MLLRLCYPSTASHLPSTTLASTDIRGAATDRRCTYADEQPECAELAKQINAATGIEDGKGMQCIQPRSSSQGYVAPYV